MEEVPIQDQVNNLEFGSEFKITRATEELWTILLLLCVVQNKWSGTGYLQQLVNLSGRTPKTVSKSLQQLEELNKQPGVKEEITGFSDTVEKYRILSDNLAIQRQAYDQAYGIAQMNLAQVGGEEAERLLGVVGKQQTAKQRQLQERMTNALRQQEFLKTELSINNLKMQAAVDEAKFNAWKTDREVVSLVAGMASSEEMGKVINNLAFDRRTGKLSYNKAELLKSMETQFGSDPNFSKAWVSLDKWLGDKTRDFTSQPPPDYSQRYLDQLKDESQKLKVAQDLYLWLQDRTADVGRWLYSDDPDNILMRDEYKRAYTDEYGQDKAANLRTEDYFKEVRLIDKIDIPALKQRAGLLYNYLWNPNSGDYYKRTLDQFTRLVGRTNIQTGETIPLKYGDIKRPVDPFTGYQYEFKVGEFDKHEDGTVDTSGIMLYTPAGTLGWHPYDPSNGIDMSTIIHQANIKALEQKTKAREKKERKMQRQIEIPSVSTLY